MDVEYIKEKGRIKAFTVNYRAEIPGEWKEVIRYDTHHGRLHLHRFWRQTNRQVEFLESTGRQEKDYAAAFQEAEKIIKENWWRYRRLYEASRNK